MQSISFGYKIINPALKINFKSNLEENKSSQRELYSQKFEDFLSQKESEPSAKESPGLNSSSCNENYQAKFSSWNNRSAPYDDLKIFSLNKKNKELIMHSIKESEELEPFDQEYLLLS